LLISQSAKKCNFSWKLTLVNWIRYLMLQLHDDDNYYCDGVHVYAATPPNRWSVVSLAPSLMADKLDLAHSKPHCCHCIIPHCSTLSLSTTLKSMRIRQQFAAFDVLFLWHKSLCRHWYRLRDLELRHLMRGKREK
jgi:hypothetical protein